MRIWKTFSGDSKLEEDKKGNKFAQNELLGIVVNVHNAGAITIVEQPSGKETKIYLSSIKAPRGGNIFKRKEAKKEDKKGDKKGDKKEEENKQEPETPPPKDKQSKLVKEKGTSEIKEKKKDEKERYWAFEGTEFLRKRAIGQRVKCVFDYSKVDLNRGGEKNYFSVYIDKK